MGSLRNTKNCNISPKRCKIGPGYYDGLTGSRIRAFDWHQNQRPWMTLIGVSRDCPKFLSTVPPIISGTGKATNFKFYTHIHGIDRKKSGKPIKNFGNSSRGRSQELPNIFGAPIYRAHRYLRDSSAFLF